MDSKIEFQSTNPFSEERTDTSLELNNNARVSSDSDEHNSDSDIYFDEKEVETAFVISENLPKTNPLEEFHLPLAKETSSNFDEFAIEEIKNIEDSAANNSKEPMDKKETEVSILARAKNCLSNLSLFQPETKEQKAQNQRNICLKSVETLYQKYGVEIASLEKSLGMQKMNCLSSENKDKAKQQELELKKLKRQAITDFKACVNMTTVSLAATQILNSAVYADAFKKTHFSNRLSNLFSQLQKKRLEDTLQPSPDEASNIQITSR